MGEILRTPEIGATFDIIIDSESITLKEVSHLSSWHTVYSMNSDKFSLSSKTDSNGNNYILYNNKYLKHTNDNTIVTTKNGLDAENNKYITISELDGGGHVNNV